MPVPGPALRGKAVATVWGFLNMIVCDVCLHDFYHRMYYICTYACMQCSDIYTFINTVCKTISHHFKIFRVGSL